MSTTSLDPTVVTKLRQFSRRRFRIILLRGACAALVTFVVGMAFVAFLDWGWVLSDNVRWGLSAGAYFLTAASAWFVGGRKLVSKPAQEEIASQVEDAEPELREHLRSAVELATDNPEAVNDSPVFRSLLQGNVAVQMAKIQVGRLLPMKLLAKWLSTAAVVVAVIAILMTTGGPRFRTLAARAVLPMANVDRVSRIQVEILQPTPHSLMIAKDETVAIVVQTSGGAVEEAILETYVEGKAPVQLAMRARTDSEFAANLHVEDDVIEYRILAGDAVTKRYTINGRNRPRVVSFHKSFQFPEYSGLQAETVTEEHGDIIVLAGTVAEIQLELDQEVSEAELRIDATNSDDVQTVPLVQNNDGNWSTVVPVDNNAIYKVHLVSSETGFDNLFSPRYEIRPVPDLIPRTGFVDQQETNLLLPPNDILALQGMAEDDLPLQILEQEISVNGREWVTLPLEVSAAAKTIDDETDFSSVPPEAHRITAAWNWDLMGLELKTGDQITTRLVATDLKGNRGESVPLRIVVSSPDFDPDRHDTMENKAALIAVLERFATVAGEHKTTALEIAKELQEEAKQDASAQRTAAEIALDCTTLIELANKTRDSAAGTLQQVLSVAKTMPAGTNAYELDLAGRVIARILHNHVATSVHATTAFQNCQDSKQRQQLAGRLKEGFERSGDDAKSLAYHYQHLVAQDIFSAFAWDFNAMLRQQALVANSPTQTFLRLRRQETLVVNQLQTVERLAKKHRRNVPDFLQNHFDQMFDFTDRWIGNLEQAMESEDELAQLQRHVQDLHRELRDRQRYDVIDGGMANRLMQARRDLDYRSGSLVEPLSLMSTATHEETRRRISASDADDSTKAQSFTDEADDFAREVDLKLRPSIEQVRTRRIISQTRIDSDAVFAADAGMTHRAITSLMNQYRQTDPRESVVPTAFREIAPAYRMLEAGHDIVNVQTMLDALVSAERWKAMDIVAITQHPAAWDAIQKGLEEAVHKLRQAGIKNEIAGRIDELRWSATVREIGRKIGERRWKRERIVSAGVDLVDLQRSLKTVAAELTPVMDEARAVIAKYAPTIPEMAKQLAQQVRQMEQKTTETADALEQPASEQQPDMVPPEQQLAELGNQQQQINQQLDDLFEALVEDANQQNLLDETERERARDADDSIAMVQEPAEQMNRSLGESQQAEAAEEQAKALARAAEHQEKTAQALELVAEHFDKLNKGEDIADSREQLREFEKEMGLARQMDQQFEDVDPLAQMTTSAEEQSLLEQLENELKNNPAMREALSEISQNTVEEARNALQDAANQDKELQKANERSDQQFQQQKKELAEQLRQLGREASDLSNRMVAQAESAASQAQTPEAKQKFQETRQQLQQAANAANNSNESDLLEELADKAKQTSKALAAATEAIKDGTEQSADARGQEIHSDDKNRENAKRNLETQRTRFVDQLKREADQRVNQRKSEHRREEANVRNAENNVRKFERDLDQAKQRAQKKPDDGNLKNQIQQAESRVEGAKKQLDAAKQKQQQAKQKENDARQERDEWNAFPKPALDDKNPAAQLAESLANEARQDIEDLQKLADALVQNSDFGQQLSPEKQQLARATQEQQNVKDDVNQTSEDLARAARHERRLENETASKALQQSANDVRKVAENEAQAAKDQLQVAEASAPESQQPNEPANANQNNEPAIAANKALQTSEQAIASQADALAPIVEAADAAAAAAQEAGSADAGPPKADAGPATAESSPAKQGSPEAGAGTPTGQAEAASSTGTSPAAPPQNGSPPQTFTPEQLAEGRQLAQALDELDRAQANAAAAESMPGQPSQPNASQLPKSLAEAAKAKAAQLAQQRAQAQQAKQLSKTSDAFNPDGMPQTEGETGEFVVKEVNRLEQEDWGKLRGKEAEDLTKGRREAVSAEYRKSVEAYFKVLSERARRQDAK